MTQTYLAAARKKQAAEKAAAATEGLATAAHGSEPAHSASPSSIREERECPFCAELILKKAKLCKHCGREVAPLT
jgi:ribosomal protein S14